MFSTATTLQGNETFVLDADDETIAICVGHNHAENAKTIAEFFNSLPESPTLQEHGEPVG